jgi:hypothetical protein
VVGDTAAELSALATAPAAPAAPPIPINNAASAPLLKADEEPEPITTGTHRTPRCVTTGVTAASAPSAVETPSGVLTATFTPAGELTTALPSSRSPLINPSLKRNIILDPEVSSTRPNFPRFTIAEFPFAQATAIRLSVNTLVPVMALFSFTVTAPVTIIWPTCWVVSFVFVVFVFPAFVVSGFFAARMGPALKAAKLLRDRVRIKAVALRTFGECVDMYNPPDCSNNVSIEGTPEQAQITSVSFFFQTQFLKDFTRGFD